MTRHPLIRPLCLLPAPRLSERLGRPLSLIDETTQLTGSFKIRAASHVAAHVRQELLITASSGNFGQALACACRHHHKRCVVVMPRTSAAIKIAGVEAHGGQVELVDVRTTPRAVRVAELARAHPEAYVASAYDDPLVIAGNASLGRDLAATALEAIVAPVGGGGLASGILTGLREAGASLPVYGAEPAIANDAARSFRSGTRVRLEAEPDTLADGARTLGLGDHTWPLLRDGLTDLFEVSEDAIRLAVRLLHELEGRRVEPTGALALASLLEAPDRMAGRHVGVVLSGGNVDEARFRELVGG